MLIKLTQINKKKAESLNVKKKKKGKKYCLKGIIPSQSSPKQLSNCSKRALN